MNEQNKENRTENREFSRSELQDLYNQLNESKKAKEKGDAYKCFGLAVAGFIIGSIFQAMVDSSMFSFTIYTNSVLLRALASFTFYVGWICIGLGIWGGIASLRRSSQNLSKIDAVRLRNDAAKMHESSPKDAEAQFVLANQIEYVLDALEKDGV